MLFFKWYETARVTKAKLTAKVKQPPQKGYKIGVVMWGEKERKAVSVGNRLFV